LAAVVAKMMAKAPADRYQTAGDAAAALRPFVRQGPAGATMMPTDTSKLPPLPPLKAPSAVEEPPVAGPVGRSVPSRNQRQVAQGAGFGRSALIYGGAALAGLVTMALIVWGVLSITTRDGTHRQDKDKPPVEVAQEGKAPVPASPPAPDDTNKPGPAG